MQGGREAGRCAPSHGISVWRQVVPFRGFRVGLRPPPHMHEGGGAAASECHTHHYSERPTPFFSRYSQKT